MPSTPQHCVPRGACDTHTHVFGRFNAFPFSHPSSYAPPCAPFAVHADMLRRVGLDRAVLVQPAPYGADCAALVDALRQYAGRARGIGTARRDIALGTLQVLHDAGIRGLRFTEVLDRGTGRRFAGSVPLDELSYLAGPMAEMGWHAQVWARCDDVPRCVHECERLGVAPVIEHMGSFDVSRGVGDPAFQELLRLVAEDRVWVKLAVCRNSTSSPDYADVRPFHDALIDANPRGLLWASDWPFVRMGERAPDVGRLLDLFHDWLKDDELERMILVDNPALLYGFAKD